MQIAFRDAAAMWVSLEASHFFISLWPRSTGSELAMATSQSWSRRPCAGGLRSQAHAASSLPQFQASSRNCAPTPTPNRSTGVFRK